jgi:hypothetical protein
VRVNTSVQWRVRRPLQLDGPSRPSLLLGARASTELACTSYVTGVRVGVAALVCCEGVRGWERGGMVTGCVTCVESCVVCRLCY